MKRTLTALLAAAMLLTVSLPAAADSPEDAPYRPQTFTVYPKPDALTVAIDGNLSEWPATSKIATVTRESLLAGDGAIWRDWIEGSDPPDYREPEELSADVYMMYTSDALYFGVRAAYNLHENTEKQPDLIWRGSSITMQLSAERDSGRNEFGFALSSWGSKLAMSYCWVGASEKTQAVFWGIPNKKDQGGHYITRDTATKTTIYEMRLPRGGFTEIETALAPDNELYLSLAFKVKGGLYEWGGGTSGFWGDADLSLANTLRLGFAPGDVDGDGTVDSTDARLVLQHEVGLLTLTEAERGRADVNGDSGVDSTDARLILQYEVGLIT